MSIGIKWHCPNCWNDEETCKCTSQEMDVYYRRMEKEKKEMDDFNKAGHKSPLWEAWEIHKKSKDQKGL